MKSRFLFLSLTFLFSILIAAPLLAQSLEQTQTELMLKSANLADEEYRSEASRETDSILDPDPAQLVLTPTGRIIRRPRIRWEELLILSAAAPLFDRIQLGGGALVGAKAYFLNPKIAIIDLPQVGVAAGVFIYNSDVWQENALSADLSGDFNAFGYVSGTVDIESFAVSGAVYMGDDYWSKRCSGGIAWNSGKQVKIVAEIWGSTQDPNSVYGGVGVTTWGRYAGGTLAFFADRNTMSGRGFFTALIPWAQFSWHF